MRVRFLDNVSFTTFPEGDDMVDIDYLVLNEIGLTKQYVNGQIVDYVNLDLLRARRENECFSVVNRGKLWYESLTEVQIIELRHWYNAWLDVTETKVIPTKPNWLR